MHITSYVIDDAVDARENRSLYYQAGLDYRIKNGIPCKINGKKWNLYWKITDEVREPVLTRLLNKKITDESAVKKYISISVTFPKKALPLRIIK